MPRPLRIQQPDALQHVISSGIEELCIFPDDRHKNVFVEYYRKAIKKSVAIFLP